MFCTVSQFSLCLCGYESATIIYRALGESRSCEMSLIENWFANTNNDTWHISPSIRNVGCVTITNQWVNIHENGYLIHQTASLIWHLLSSKCRLNKISYYYSYLVRLFLVHLKLGKKTQEAECKGVDKWGGMIQFFEYQTKNNAFKV